MTSLPPLNETNSAPGTPLTSYERTISLEDVEKFVSRTGEDIESYRRDGEVTVPAGMMMGMYGPLIHGTFHYEAGVHVSSDLTVKRVPRVDEPIRVGGKVLDLFEKNGNKYVTFSVEVRTHDGEELATVAHTSIYALRKKSS